MAGSEVQQRLLDAALDALQGSAAVDFSVQAVLAAAGSNRTELYATYGSKDRLVLAAVAEAVRRTVTAIDAHLEDAAGAAAVATWVRMLLRRADDGAVAAATRPFALDAHRLVHRFPDSEEVLRLPLQRQVMRFLPKGPQRALKAEAILGLTMHAQAMHLARGSAPTRREVDFYVAAALRVAQLAEG